MCSIFSVHIALSDYLWGNLHTISGHAFQQFDSGSSFSLFATNTIPIMNHKYLRFKIHFHNCNSTFKNHIRAAFLFPLNKLTAESILGIVRAMKITAVCVFLLELRLDSRFYFYSFKILMCIFAILSHFLIQNTAIIYVCHFISCCSLMLLLFPLLLMIIMGALVLASFCQRFVLIFRFVLQLQQWQQQYTS